MAKTFIRLVEDGATSSITTVMQNKSLKYLN